MFDFIAAAGASAGEAVALPTTTTRTRNAETGMVYRGACDLIHIQDGQRAETGATLAGYLDTMMRTDALNDGTRTYAQTFGPDAQPLCPGCYMVAVYNMAITLAQENGQSLAEMGRSLSRAFANLAALADEGATGDALRMESIAVALDAEGDAPLGAPRVLEVA
jgi:hypothetical protein